MAARRLQHKNIRWSVGASEHAAQLVGGSCFRRKPLVRDKDVLALGSSLQILEFCLWHVRLQLRPWSLRHKHEPKLHTLKPKH